MAVNLGPEHAATCDAAMGQAYPLYRYYKQALADGVHPDDAYNAARVLELRDRLGPSCLLLEQSVEQEGQ